MDIYVIGHRNPDTDSVGAAIAYAHLKNSISNDNFIAKKAGNLNEETRYVLRRFEIDEPETMTDVGTQVMDIDYRKIGGISSHMSLQSAWNMMQEMSVVTLPIVDEKNKLVGVITEGDVANACMDVYDNFLLSSARTQYKNIIDTLNATVVCGNEHAYFTKGKVMVLAGDQDLMKVNISSDDLVILGNNYDTQLIALERNASCIIVCNEVDIKEDIIQRAKEQQVVLLTTDLNIFTTARLINHSIPVKRFMTKKHLVCFEPDDYIDDVKVTMGKIRHRDFPIVDEQFKYLGMISRRYLFNMPRKNVILVDHNEKLQAVDKIEEANVIEIVDHHRLGSLETISPIFFRNQPLGSSSSIVTMMYEEAGVEIPKKIAGLLCAAIISDTLLFRSPTCTPVDVEIAKRLAKVAEVDLDELATAMFEAGSNFKNRTPEEIFYSDFKEFTADEHSFAVSQISAVSGTQLHSIMDGIRDVMKTVPVKKNVGMVFTMLTDIIDENSYLLCEGDGAKDIACEAFGVEAEDDVVILKGVVSRKKQLVPRLIETIEAQD